MILSIVFILTNMIILFQDLQDLPLGDGEDCSGGHVWEDEETRRFYTELPNVKEFVAQLNSQVGLLPGHYSFM